MRSASYPDASLARAKEGGEETTGETALRLPSVPFPWSLAAHRQSLASTLRKTKRLRRRLLWDPGPMNMIVRRRKLDFVAEICLQH